MCKILKTRLRLRAKTSARPTLASTLKTEIQSSRRLLEVDPGAYSKALGGGRNNCTMREEISTAQTDA